MSRILVIDDDVELCELLTTYLEPAGFEVRTAHDAKTGIELVFSGSPELTVLDVMLPGANGFDVLRRIRGHSSVPVLMLTARGDDVDRIVGLEAGADDYLPKPFNPRELAARIRAILRRAGQPYGETAPAAPRVAVGDVELDPGSRIVKRDGGRIDLTAVEFHLLEVLMRGAGSVVPRAQIAKLVFGRDPEPYDRSIDVHVSSLRKKLGRHSDGAERIKTVRGVGYLYSLPGTKSGGEGS